jgi:phage gp46-like protein/photosystem II stability/assembly factor-like uncharacterized protein
MISLTKIHEVTLPGESPYGVISKDGSSVLISYNFNRIYYSSDGGNNFTELRPAGDVSRTWDGLAISADGSKLLVGCHNAPQELYYSVNRGNSWTLVRNNSSFYGAAISSDGAKLCHCGTFALGYSPDSGASWISGPSTAFFHYAAMSDDGSKVLVAGTDSLLLSTDSGVTFLSVNPAPENNKGYYGCCMSSDGSILVTGQYNKRLWKSINSGSSWVELRPIGDVDSSWCSFSMSADGTKIVVCNDNNVFLSLDEGQTWENVFTNTGVGGDYGLWFVSMSAIGNEFIIGYANGDKQEIYLGDISNSNVKYIDTNNAYDEESGNGSIDSPHSFPYWYDTTSVWRILENKTNYLKGSRAFSEPAGLFHAAIASPEVANSVVSYEILPWDIAQLDLPKFISSAPLGVVFSANNGNTLNVSIKNVVIKAGSSISDSSSFAMSGGGSAGNVNIDFISCYIILSGELVLPSINAVTSRVRFLGCTFVSGEADYAILPSYRFNRTFVFEYCYFAKMGSVETPLGFNSSFASTTTFKGCYFEDAADYVVNNEFDPEYSEYLSDRDIGGCVFSYSPTVAIPNDPSLLTIAAKTIVLYSGFGLPAISDPTIIAEWDAGGYNSGLFDETRLSVGAFYFSERQSVFSSTKKSNATLVFDSDNFDFDLNIFNGDIIRDDDLQTAVIISLFSDARATDDDMQGRFDNPRGWFAGEVGSLLWLLERAKTTDDLKRYEDAAAESLQWLVSDGVAESVSVSIARSDTYAYSVSVEIKKPKNLVHKYQFAWNAQESK